jgi:hypothetical protein
MQKIDFDNVPKEFPFIGTYEEFEKLFVNINNLKDKIITSDNPREIIFESWFIFDYYIRQMILKGLQLQDYENEKLDLMYGLLPQSFDSCLSLFENILINQRDIYINKKHPNTFIKYQESSINMNGGFIGFLINEKKELFDEFFSEYYKYLQRSEPEYNNAYNEWDYSKYKIYKVVKKRWLEKCEKLDSEWFKTIRKLNKCRNKAAHLYSDSHIYSIFGINGNDKLKELKVHITDLIKQTLNFDM